MMVMSTRDGNGQKSSSASGSVELAATSRLQAAVVSRVRLKASVGWAATTTCRHAGDSSNNRLISNLSNVDDDDALAAASSDAQSANIAIRRPHARRRRLDARSLLADVKLWPTIDDFEIRYDQSSIVDY